MNEAMHAAHAARVSRGLEGAFPWGRTMKKPAERDCVAVVPGYTGQVAKLYLGRDEEAVSLASPFSTCWDTSSCRGTAEAAA